MKSPYFLLYGANGYTGELIARLANTYDLKPILAGRNETAIRQLADELQSMYRVVDLANHVPLQSALRDVSLVLHAAGPFQLTSKAMIDACIATNTHYIDITGEIAVYEMARQYDAQAINRGIMIMPGVGFDVVPTDCMALYLKQQLPDAVKLQLAFASDGGGLSHGTAATMIMGLGEGGAVREDGRIVNKPLGHKGMWVDIEGKRLFMMTIPWGDVSTAYFTTGIPNIETYTSVNPAVYKLLKLQKSFNWLLKRQFIRNYALNKIRQQPPGPSADVRANSHSLVYGKVENRKGEFLAATMKVPDGYSFTAHSSLLIAQKILSCNSKAGYQTPASVYGENLVLEIPGSTRNPAR